MYRVTAKGTFIKRFSVTVFADVRFWWKSRNLVKYYMSSLHWKHFNRFLTFAPTTHFQYQNEQNQRGSVALIAQIRVASNFITQKTCPLNSFQWRVWGAQADFQIRSKCQILASTSRMLKKLFSFLLVLSSGFKLSPKMRNFSL